MRTAEYISEAKRRTGISSDYALAKRLGTGSTTVASWTSGRSVPDARFAFKLAELLGEDPVPVLANIEIERAERAGSDDAAMYWRNYLGRLSDTGREYVGKAGTVITGILIGAVLTAPPPANASSGSPMKTVPASQGDSVYYVNYKSTPKVPHFDHCVPKVVLHHHQIPLPTS